jgi:endonuclease/exonuclease/phosphatase family metal-dependent hydrolase
MSRVFVYCLCAFLFIASLATAVGDDTRRLTVMTYNVLYGAGVNSEDERIANRWSSGKYHGNRLDRVISVIKQVNPDIVGIEEASSWDKDNEAAAKQVAGELGMNYFVGRSERSRFHVALFSKFPIVSARNFPDQFSRAAIEAEIKLPDGRLLHTFVAHFNLARSGKEQLEEIQYLAKQMKPYADDIGVFMGDANMTYREGKDTTDALRASGFLIAPSIRGIDQIWASKPLAADVKAGPAIPSALTSGVSDHRPSVVMIGIPAAEEEQDCGRSHH